MHYTMNRTSAYAAQSKFANVVAGIITGLILLSGGIWLFTANQAKTGPADRALNRAGYIAREIAPKVDPVNEGKLVCFTGRVRSTGFLSDRAFGITEHNILSLQRTVLTTHPAEKRLQNKRWDCWSVTVEDFAIPPDQIPLVLNELKKEPLPISRINSMPPGGRISGDAVYYEKEDCSVSWEIIPKDQVVTICGVQRGILLEPFEISEGEIIFLVRRGKHTAKTLCNSAMENSTEDKWLVRVAAILLGLVGIMIFFTGISWRKQ